MRVFVFPVPAEASTRSDARDVRDGGRRAPPGRRAAHGISSRAKRGLPGRASVSACALGVVDPRGVPGRRRRRRRSCQQWLAPAREGVVRGRRSPARIVVVEKADRRGEASRPPPRSRPRRRRRRRPRARLPPSPGTTKRYSDETDARPRGRGRRERSGELDLLAAGDPVALPVRLPERRRAAELVVDDAGLGAVPVEAVDPPGEGDARPRPVAAPGPRGPRKGRSGPRRPARGSGLLASRSRAPATAREEARRAGRGGFGEDGREVDLPVGEERRTSPRASASRRAGGRRRGPGAPVASAARRSRARGRARRRSGRRGRGRRAAPRARRGRGRPSGEESAVGAGGQPLEAARREGAVRRRGARRGAREAAPRTR